MPCNINLRVTAIMVSLILVASCANLKLDAPGPKVQTLLVLPVEITNETQSRRHGFYYIYEIRHVGGDGPYEAIFKLPLKGDMLIIDSLPPGNYIVDKFIFKSIGAGDFSYGDNIQYRDDRFHMAAGHITIFPKSLNVRKFHRIVGETTETSYTANMNSVTDAQKKKILTTLEELQNFDKWALWDM